MIKTEDYFREFVTIIFIQKKLILGIAALFIVGSLLIAFLWPPLYAAKGQIMLKRNQPLTSPGSLEDVRPEIQQLGQDDLFSEMEILNSRTVIERTAARLLRQNSYEQVKQAEEQDKIELANRIEKNLSVEMIPESTVLRTRLTWQDRGTAKIMLATFLEEYINYRSELFNPKEAQTFFQQQISNFTNALNQREKELVKLAESGSIFAPEDQIKSNLLIKENLESELTRLRSEVAQNEVYISQIQESLRTREMSFFTAIDNLEIGDLGKRLQELFMDKQELLKTYANGSKQVTRTEEQIQAVMKSLRQEVEEYITVEQAKLEANRKSIAAIENQLAQIEKRNVALYTNRIKNNRLKREINMLEESYATLAKRLEEAEINANTRADSFFNVTILSKPQVGKDPVFPQKIRVIPLGVLIGLLVGATIGFIVEFFDHRFKRPEDVDHYAELPHICSIPRW